MDAVLTNAAGMNASTNHLDHHVSTVLRTAACFGSSQRSLAFRLQRFNTLVTLSPPSSSSSASDPSSLPFPKTTSPNRAALKVPNMPLPLYPRLLLRPLSGTARKRPRRGLESVMCLARDSVPCWNWKNEGIPSCLVSYL